MDEQQGYLVHLLRAYPLNKVKHKTKKSSLKEFVVCPAVMKQYNEYMYSVDLMDQKKVT